MILSLRVVVARSGGGRSFRLRRFYRVLAIESSCDDSCLALLEKLKGKSPIIIDEMKRTLNSQATGGIVPTKAQEFHQQEIGNMILEFSGRHGLQSNPPDVICCTRGPGMVGSLSASLQIAKGLSIGWNKPMIGVHHMLGHVLISQLPESERPNIKPPEYPFLSLLCSGGHTMLLLLKSISDHEIIIETSDIAVGDSIDKCARELGIEGNLLGKELEKYVNSIPPELVKEFLNISTETRGNEFEFKLKKPLRGPHNPVIPDTLTFSFAPFLSSIQHFKSSNELTERSKQFIAYKTQKLIFQHIIDRVNISLLKHGIREDSIKGKIVKGDKKFEGVRSLVLSGGVASNRIFRDLLQEELRLNLLGNEEDFQFHFPDVRLCTDNAVMIGVAGIEILETLHKRTDLNVLPIRKWPMNKLLDVDGWIDMEESEIKRLMNK